MIMRDGTTAHIPYLSTYEGYNHRITLSNRGSQDADYEFTFRPEEGVTAMPGMYAEGTLTAGETMILKQRMLFRSRRAVVPPRRSHWWRRHAP